MTGSTASKPDRFRIFAEALLEEALAMPVEAAVRHIHDRFRLAGPQHREALLLALIEAALTGAHVDRLMGVGSASAKPAPAPDPQEISRC